MANKLIIGPVEAPILTFENPQIHSLGETAALSLVGAELSMDTLKPVVEYEIFLDYVLVSNDGYSLISSDGYELHPYANYDLRKLPYATKLSYYINDRVHGEFYSKNVERVGESRFKINAISAVGLSAKQSFLGGIYTGQRLDAVLAEILGGDYEYQITEDAAKQQVYGLIPPGSRRDALHQLVVAYGVTIIRSDSGGMLFTLLGDTTPQEIPDSRVYIDGDVDYNDPASRIELTEHAYFYLDTVTEETVFDNRKADMVTNSTVTFAKPFYPESLRCSEGNLVISKSGVNFAVVSGTGVLVGKPYTHTTRILVKNNPNAVVENVKRMEKATLVTVANSDNVLLRLAEYYFNATVVNSSIELDTEKPGRRVRLSNAFREQTTGFISKMSTTASSITKADCEIIQNYVPRAAGNAYNNLEVLTAASGIWTIPESVFEKESPTIRVVLIGPGAKGKPGNPGEAGARATDTSPGKGGKGGDGGLGGDGGKILSLTIDCTGIVNFAFSIGSSVSFKGGGFELNSANGASSPDGFLDVFTGTVYALPGKAGQAGAPGGKGGKYTHSTTGAYAEAGQDLTYNGRTYKGGQPGTRALIKGASVGLNASMEIYAGRGGGSGAAVGVSGKKSSDGASNTHSYGADGVKPVKAEAASSVPGSGGNGGHGGSGAGGGGISEWYNADYTTVISTDPYPGGAAGPGGEGSEGAPGAILIYH